jgi:hypothetical protein
MINLKAMSSEELDVATVTQELEAIIDEFRLLGLGGYERRNRELAQPKSCR